MTAFATVRVAAIQATPVILDGDKAVFGEGGAAIVEPTWGNVIAGPLRGREGMVVADCDLRAGLHAKRWFDAVGHYGRAEVLDPGRRLSADAHDGPAPRLPGEHLVEERVEVVE